MRFGHYTGWKPGSLLIVWHFGVDCQPGVTAQKPLLLREGLIDHLSVKEEVPLVGIPLAFGLVGKEVGASVVGGKGALIFLQKA